MTKFNYEVYKGDKQIFKGDYHKAKKKHKETKDSKLYKSYFGRLIKQ